MSEFRRLALALLASALACGAALADLSFVEVSPAQGIQPYAQSFGHGSGVAAADFDDDGDIDLFVTTTAGMADQLYRNLGDGNFEEIGVAVGVGSLAASRTAVWLDYDGDHRLDLFVAGDCFDAPPGCPLTSTLRLYRQTVDGVFEEVSAAAGIDDDLVVTSAEHRGGIAAGDIDNDGWLDLLVSLWGGEARLFRNRQDGSFEEISDESGIGGQSLGHWQPMFVDIDGDGWQDIYQAIDFTENKMWINQRDGTFVDVAFEAGLDIAWNDMGLTVGDYDNDGDFDFYVTNITTGPRHNALLRNDSTPGELRFVEVSRDLQVDDGGWGWGTTFFDADHDGWLDIAATNGWLSGFHATDRSVFFRNPGAAGGAFDDMSDATGFNDNLWGSALVAVDLDRDGDLDLVQTANGSGPQPSSLRLLDCVRDGVDAERGWLTVRPRMLGPNHRAIGAVVRATVGELTMTRLISAGTSYYGQEPAEAFFGLGDAAQVDRLIVEWPDGSRTTLENVAINQRLDVEPMRYVDTLEFPGAQPDVLTESLAWGDYDGDGDDDLYLTNHGPNVMLRNDGDGLFTDVTIATGTGDAGFGVGTAFGDLDNDGDLDIYVVSFEAGADVLYRNDGPVGPDGEHSFTDVAALAGIDNQTSSRGMTFLDHDRDGLLDIYVNAIGPDLFYRNLGNLQFDEIAVELGIATPGQGAGVVATDIDGNGWIDLFTGNHSSQLNRLYRNDGGVFTDVTLSAGILSTGLGMGVLALDHDNDLDPDLYWTSWPATPNALYENLDGNLFVNRGATSGTLDALGWGVSANAGDIDNDGWEDFFVTNGFSATTSPNVLFHNRGNGSFGDVTGLLGDGAFDGRGVAFADHDGDGDLDLAVTAGSGAVTRLWRNEPAVEHHWLTLVLEGTCANRSAIGARVEVTTDRRTTMKEVSGGAGRGSQNSLALEFGLGQATTIEAVEVHWPDGFSESYPGPPLDSRIALTESPLCSSPGLIAGAGGLFWKPGALPAGPTPTYDVIRGSLATLRQTGGDFSQSVLECAGGLSQIDDFPFAEGPRRGAAFWYLVRTRRGEQALTWDVATPSLIESRDAELAAAPESCP